MGGNIFVVINYLQAHGVILKSSLHRRNHTTNQTREEVQVFLVS